MDYKQVMNGGDESNDGSNSIQAPTLTNGSSSRLVSNGHNTQSISSPDDDDDEEEEDEDMTTTGDEGATDDSSDQHSASSHSM